MKLLLVALALCPTIWAAEETVEATETNEAAENGYGLGGYGAGYGAGGYGAGYGLGGYGAGYGLGGYGVGYGLGGYGAGAGYGLGGYGAGLGRFGVGYGLGGNGIGYGGIGYGVGPGIGLGYGFGFPRFAARSNKFQHGLHANNAFGVNAANKGAVASAHKHHNDLYFKKAVEFKHSKGAKATHAKSHANKFGKHSKNAFKKNINAANAAKRAVGGVW